MSRKSIIRLNGIEEKWLESDQGKKKVFILGVLFFNGIVILTIPKRLIMIVGVHETLSPILFMGSLLITSEIMLYVFLFLGIELTEISLFGANVKVNREVAEAELLNLNKKHRQLEILSEKLTDSMNVMQEIGTYIILPEIDFIDYLCEAIEVYLERRTFFEKIYILDIGNAVEYLCIDDEEISLLEEGATINKIVGSKKYIVFQYFPALFYKTNSLIVYVEYKNDDDDDIIRLEKGIIISLIKYVESIYHSENHFYDNLEDFNDNDNTEEGVSNE